MKELEYLPGKTDLLFAGFAVIRSWRLGINALQQQTGTRSNRSEMFIILLFDEKVCRLSFPTEYGVFTFFLPLIQRFLCANMDYVKTFV
jgi:hypothetical protein